MTLELSFSFYYCTQARTACCVDDCYSSKLIESLQDINELHKDLEEVGCVCSMHPERQVVF